MTTEDMDQQADADGESESNDDWRRVLQAGIGAAGLTGLAGLTSAQQGSQNLIELEAVTVETSGGRGRSEFAWEDGEGGVVRGPPEEVCSIAGGTHLWVGVSPDSIAELTNPTLELTAGETYTVEWTNTDGEEHNFVIADADGTELVASDTIAEEGATQSVEFEATEEMATYYCGPHSESQSGSIEVSVSAGEVEVSNLDPSSVTVSQGDAVDFSATVSNTGDSSLTQVVSLSIDGSQVASKEVSLDAGAETSVSFTGVDTSDLSDGDHTVTIASGGSQVSGTLTVEVDDADGDWHRDLDVPTNPEEATNWDNYEVTNVFSTGTISSEYDLKDGEEGEWMQMDVDAQGRIWVVTRGASFVTEGDGYAEVAWVDPDSGEHQLALEIPVAFHGGHVADSGEVSAARELGGQGIAIDPDFEDNGYVYVMYHPSSDDLELVDNPYDDNIVFANMRVSRFTMQDDGTLDPDSEKVVFTVPEQWHTCCHHGAYITFGEDREFYISTGDNSNNVGNPDNLVNWFMGDERQGMIHGRPGPVADAQRTSGNTADKRGKVHRIVLNEDGTYDIPDGNLKEHWEEETGESYSDDEFLPSIYVMGLRNPFTITYDDHSGYLWTGHYGNDGGSISDLGMSGFGDYHLWCEPGNAGYPYYRAYYPYRDYDFENDEVGQPFWPDNLRNESVNNTGIENIPNVTPALIWHPQSFDDYENALDIHPWLDQPRPGEVTYPELDAGGSADVGVVYRYDEGYSEHALPPYFDGKPFFMNPSNADVVRYLTFNDDGSLDINEFGARDGVAAAYDMKVLPDGRLAIMGMYSGIHIVEYNGPAPGYQPPPEEEQPDRVEPAADGLSGDPPGDATVLWDGDDATLDGWEQLDGSEAQWNETADYFEVDPSDPDVEGNVRPKEDLGDVHLHLEWRVPEEVAGEAEGQGPGNSGLFMMETYEFQILQSHDNPTYPSGYAGSFYKYQEGGGSAPLAMPIRPPGEWNSYDLIWRRPRFDDDGNVVRLPQATLLFNGVVVQQHLNIPGPVWYDTLYPFDHEDFGHPRDENGNFLTEAPFHLQNHGNDYDVVQYRNVWYRDLPERPVTESEHPDNVPEYSTSGGPYYLPNGDQYQPQQISPGGSGTTGTPPGDADVLLDDSITIQPGDGDWVSDSKYGDAQVHVEYRIPEDVEGEGPLRGNSGVLMMGNYEIQILDTWENPVEADEWAGAYTHQNGPHHDAVREPGEWQQLDLVWQAPRFSGGELEKPAQVTAFLNGVAVQTRLVVDGPNKGFTVNPYSEHGKMPLRLREEGSEIDFRNAWIREEQAELVSDEPSEPEQLSAPIGLDLGGLHTDETVTVDGLEFLPTPSQSEQVGIEENRTLDADEKYWPEQVTVEPEPRESPGATDSGRPLNEEQNLGTNPDIEGTEHDSMYWTEQWSNDELNYTFDIENGVYEVTLHFAEVWFAGEDTRVFSGSVNGETVFEELDLYADHGPDTAVTFSHVTEVTDNELVVSLESSVENPKISGIEIREVDKVAHYDATTLELSDGDAVSSWSDAGGVGPDLTQSDSAAQPTFQTDVANGNPTVRFEGDGDYINADEVVTEDTAGVTMAAAFRTSDPTVPRQTIMYNGSDGELNGYGAYVNNEAGSGPASEGYVNGLYGGVNWWWSDTTVGADNFHVVTWTVPEDEPDHPVLRLDGQELDTELQIDPAEPETPTTQFGIGYDDGAVDERPPFFAGDIGEVRVYNRELSGAELSQLESDLGEKWGADVQAPDLSAGLAGHWTFESGNVDGDTVLDKSGNGHDGTVQGGVTTDLSAPTVGGAAEFNGSDGTVVVPNADGLDPAAYTVSAWLKTDATGPWAAVLGKENSMWCGFNNDTGQPRFDPYNGAEQGDYFSSDTAVDDGSWHHVVYRHAPSEDTSRIYVDGQQVGSMDGATESPAADTSLGIGSKSGFKDWFSGTLADVRLYDRPLSESKISLLSQQG
ncbi:family 16 glycoside hydrolase [Halomicrobium urmianum]|uniref:family 16 glycoside hydrolase n=1 Tax=Halomicrobium urmianum TaxID=1586233 RepID=UPI001CD98DEF|nr:family 16 glycoside hydrolase [Halomicrobium urmianum]